MHGTMRTERKEEMNMRGEYVTGSRVQIIGGIYWHGSPVGTVVGATRCYVDVEVPRLNCQVRVRKTSVVPCSDMQEQGKFANVMKKEPQVAAVLIAICTLLGKCGIRKGDEELHEAVDMCLDVVRRQEVTCRKN